MTDTGAFVKPVPRVNPFDAIPTAREMAGSNIAGLSSVDPDARAQAIKLAAMTGTNPSAAQDALKADPMRGRAVLDHYDRILAQNPRLSAWLNDPNNAAISHDDVAKLGSVEAAVAGHAEAHHLILAPGLAAGYEDANVGTRVLAAIALNQDPKWAAQGIADAEKMRRAITGLRPSGLQGFGFDLVRGAAGMAPALAGSFLGGATGAAAGAPVAGGLEALTPVAGPLAPLTAGAGALVEAYAAAIGAKAGLFTGLGITGAGSTAAGLLGADTDLSDPAAVEARLRDPAVVARIKAAAFKGGAASAGMLMALQGLVPPGSIVAGAAEKGLLGKAAAVAGEVGAQGAIMQTSNVVGQAVATGKLPSNQEFMAEVPGSLGAAATFVVPELGKLGMGDPARAETLAKADHAALSAAVEAAKPSATRTRNQDRFTALAQSMADGADVSTLYIPREAWDRVQTAAGNVPAVEAEKLTGSPTAYQDSTGTGVLEVTYGRALALLPDRADAPEILKNATVRPGGMTFAEADASATAREKAAESVAAQTPPAEDAAALDEQASALEAGLGIPAGATRLFQGGAGGDAAALALASKPLDKPVTMDEWSAAEASAINAVPGLGGIYEQPPLPGKTEFEVFRVIGFDPHHGAESGVDLGPWVEVQYLKGGRSGASYVWKQLAGLTRLRTLSPPDERAGPPRLMQGPVTPDTLTTAADALDKAAEGQASVGQPDPAVTLKAAEPALRAAGIAPEDVAAAVKADPTKAAADLRALADVRKQQGADTSPYSRIRSEAIAAGQSARNADALARLHESFHGALVAAGVPSDRALAMSARIARGLTPDEAALFQTAYHGSPHEFEQFSLHKIGTGEGAQAFGWGLYFADAKAVAEAYQPRTRYNKLTGKDEPLPAAKRGKLYTVDLTPQPDDYLSWDKPLSEQSDKVKAALQSIADGTAPALKTLDAIAAESISADVEGAIDADVPYQLLHETLVGDDIGAQGGDSGAARGVSELLNSAGIPGIKYLDQASRAQNAAWGDRTDATYNYVLFDDKLVKITKMEQRPAGQEARGAYTPATRLIELFGKADPSTLVHESEHHFVNVIGQLAAEPDAPESVKQLWADTLESVGSTDGTLTREQHEALAKAFESYFLRGEAPSPKLRRVFALLRNLIMGVYRAARESGAVVSDAMRSVFDRQLATDAEIAAAQNERGPMLPIGREDVSPELQPAYDALARQAQDVSEAAAEKLSKKMMADLTLEAKRERARMLDTLREEEAKRLDATPAFRAVADLTTGDVKLDRASLAERFDEPTVKALEKAGVVASEGGIPPDAAAEQYGFATTGDLVNGILGAADREKAIDASARQRLATEHPELYLAPEARRAEANRALDAGDGRSKVIDATIAFLKKREGEAKPLERAKAAERRAVWDAIPRLPEARDVAERTLAGRKLSDIKPNAYLAAARKEATAARDAARAGKDLEAAQAAGRQLVNHELYRQAKNIVEQGNKDAAFVSRTVPAIKESDWKLHASALAAKFGLARLRPDQVTEAGAMSEWLKSLEAESQREPDDDAAAAPSYVIVPEVAFWLRNDQSPARSWRDLTPAQMTDLRSSIDSIATAARALHAALTGDKTQSIADRASAAGAVVTASKSKDKEVIPPRSRGRADKATRFKRGAAAEMRTIDSYAAEMDGAAHGPVHDALIVPKNQAEDALQVEFVANRKLVDAALSNLTAAEQRAFHSESAFESRIAGRNLTRGEVLGVMLAEGNVEGRQRNRVQAIDSITKRPIGFTEEQLDAMKRSLTPSEVATLNATWAAEGRYWPQLKAQAERMKGFAPPAVVATPFAVPAGELTGGYHMLMYEDERAYNQSAADQAQLVAQGIRRGATVSMRSMTERVAKSDRPLRYDYGVVTEALALHARMLTLAEAAHDLNATLAHPSLRDPIIARYGPEAYRAFRSAYRDMAAGTQGLQSAIGKSMDTLRRNTVSARIALNAMSELRHVTNGLQRGMVRVGIGPAMREVARFYSNPAEAKRMIEQASELSSFFANRPSAFYREQAEAMASVDAGAGVSRGVAIVKRGVELGHTVMSAAQRGVDTPIWWAEFRTAATDGATTEQAIQRADQVIRDTQGSGLPADMPAIMRNPSMKVWTVMYGQANKSLNLGAEALGRVKWSDPASVIDFGTKAVLLAVMPSLTAYAGYRLLRGDKPHDTEAKAAAKGVGAGVAYQVLETVPGIPRELAALFEGINDYNGPSGTSFLQPFYNLAIQVRQGDVDAGLAGAASDTAGTLTGLPFPTLERGVRGWDAMMSGNAPVTAPLFGKPHK